MKLVVKIAIGVLSGFAAGFGAGFLTHKKMNDVEFEEVSQEEMNILEEQAKKEHPITEELKKSESPVPGVEKVSDLPEDPDKIRMTLQGKVSYLQADKEAKLQYSQIWDTVKKYSSEENADELPLETGFDPGFMESISEEDSKDADQVDEGTKPPYPIPLEEFYNSRPDYDKITLDWYEPNTFLDENEKVIADMSSYIGDIDIVALFGENGPDEDPDVRYIRNEGYGSDYEIVRHHRSWSETVGGSE